VEELELVSTKVTQLNQSAHFYEKKPISLLGTLGPEFFKQLLTDEMLKD